MVETNSNQMTIRSAPLTKNLTIPNQAYLTTAMLLGTQNCNYLGQRLNNLREHIADNDLVLNASVQPINHTREQINQQHGQIQSSPSTLHRHQMDKDNEKTIRDDVKMRDCSTGSMTTSTSTFTIDSILASKPNDVKFEYNLKSESRSPSNSPSLSSTSSPVRPTRVPAMLHPGLHLSHLAAAAATGFGTPSDFLGKLNICVVETFRMTLTFIELSNSWNCLVWISLGNFIRIFASTCDSAHCFYFPFSFIAT